MESGDPVFSFMLAFCAGGATCIGALVPFFVKSTSSSFLAGSLGFSAGVMSFVSFIDIFAKSHVAFLNYIGDKHAFLATLGCFFGGIFFAAFLDFLVHRMAHLPEEIMPPAKEGYLAVNTETMGDVSSPEDNSGEDGQYIAPSNRRLSEVTTVKFLQHPIQWIKEDWRGFRDESLEGQRLKTMGSITALAIAIHNFPEGLATFVAAMSDPGTGVALAFAIAVHNVPEGISVAMPIYYATGSRLRAFMWAAVSGLSEPLGAALGWGITSIADNEVMFGVMFGIVAGMMIFISVKELIPTAHSYDREDKFASWSFIFGMMVMAASLLIFEYV